MTTSCANTDKSSTPMMASWNMKLDISRLTYKEFTDEYAKGEESWISEEEFLEVKGLITDSVGHETYGLLKFDNGEMVLVEFAASPEKGDYKIQGIKVVPEEIKSFFK